jgi:1,2-diacylglycerol 3-beta-glucosyltransferase
MIALSRDKPTVQEYIKDIIKYYIYCFHLIPLFFMTMYTMMTRRERRWSKTEHKGGKK